MWVVTRVPSGGCYVLPSALGKPVPGVSSQPEASSHRGVGAIYPPATLKRTPGGSLRKGPPTYR